jgi:hypothetical protein
MFLVLCYSSDAICCMSIHPIHRVEKPSLKIGGHDGGEIAKSVHRKDSPVTKGGARVREP